MSIESSQPQADKFRNMAKELECDEDESAFEKGHPQYDAGGNDAHLAMTTNERLGYFGLLTDFNRAGKARDRDGMIAALEGAKFDRPAAEKITDTTLSNPAKYGF